MIDFELVSTLQVLDKHFNPDGTTNKAVAGISQRLEKEALKEGLFDLIMKHGLPLADLCTDQCKGAAADIRLVMQKEAVQKMLHKLPARMQRWVALQLGARSASPAGSGESWRWRDVVNEVRQAVDAMVGSLPKDDAASILESYVVHHFDVYHVEVRVRSSIVLYVLYLHLLTT